MITWRAARRWRSALITIAVLLGIALSWWIRTIALTEALVDRELPARFLGLNEEDILLTPVAEGDPDRESFFVTVLKRPNETSESLTPFLFGDTVEMTIDVRGGYVCYARAHSSEYLRPAKASIGVDEARDIAAAFFRSHYPLQAAVPNMVIKYAGPDVNSDGEVFEHVFGWWGRQGQALTGNSCIIAVGVGGRIISYTARVAPQQSPPQPKISKEEARKIVEQKTTPVGSTRVRVEVLEPQLTLSSHLHPSGGPVWSVPFNTWARAPQGYPYETKDGWVQLTAGILEIDGLSGKVLRSPEDTR